MKRVFPKYFLILIIVFSLAGCSTQEKSKTEETEAPKFDYLALDVYEYDYPQEFTIGDNLSQAIWLYAHNIKTGGTEPSVSMSAWSDDFMLFYIGNSDFNNDYLYAAKRKNNAKLSRAQVEYIQYSLTGKYISFEKKLENGEYPLEKQEKIIRVGEIELLDVKEDGDIITVEVHIKTATGGFPATIKLQKDPYSCFDGYNIIGASVS